jgi:hypothetical protein
MRSLLGLIDWIKDLDHEQRRGHKPKWIGSGWARACMRCEQGNHGGRNRTPRLVRIPTGA